MEVRKQRQSELQVLAKSHNTTVSGTYTNVLAKIEVVCDTCQRKWSETWGNHMRATKWCCDDLNTLVQALTKAGIEHELNYTHESFNIPLAVFINEIAHFVAGEDPTLTEYCENNDIILHSLSAQITDFIIPAVIPAPVASAVTTGLKGGVDVSEWQRLGDNSYASIPLNISIEEQSIVAYIRVSTSYQEEEGVSLIAQISKIEDYAKYKHLPIRRIYMDSGISGRTTAERLALQQLLNEIRPAEILVIANMSRLARNIADAIAIESDIRSKNASIMTLDMNIDTGSNIGRLLFNLLNSLSQFESDQTSERVRTAMQVASARGELKTKPRYGYKFIGKGKPHTIDQQEYNMIEYIRSLRQLNPHWSLTRICQHLNELPETDRCCRKAKKWYEHTLKSVMENNEIKTEAYRAGVTVPTLRYA